MTKPAHYQMPRPYLGQIVYHRYRPQDRPCPGMVIEIGNLTVDLQCFRADGRFELRDGIRHSEDPDLKINAHIAQRGFWDFIPQVEQLVGNEEASFALDDKLPPPVNAGKGTRQTEK